MARNKKIKREKNVVLVFVEGKSEKLALEGPISALFDEVNPDYRVIFALQRRKVNNKGIEEDDSVPDDAYDLEEYDYEDEEIEYEWGGDVTSSAFVEPKNIETKITNRFFKPLVDSEKIYSKMVREVIQIVDLDGAYIGDERIVPLSKTRSEEESPYYDSSSEVIECTNPELICERNERKRKNIDYLRKLDTIKIESKSIPYSVYYFSSNLDHFLHGNPNAGREKVRQAREFSAKYVFDTKGFYNCFMMDNDSSTDLTYDESWDEVINGNNSIKRKTNINILLKRIREQETEG